MLNFVFVSIRKFNCRVSIADVFMQYVFFVLLLATFANFEKSWIAFTPDESKPPAPASILTPSSTPLAPASSQLVQDENCYLMSADDIATLTCVSKLVVLSCGRGGQQLTLCDNAMNLCSAFIAAGE